ncbi:MAG: hypothetical protein EPO51_16645 [Phenylobacterium sp.]|uniref:hypothetical protein n=1 Tax=Phenylobacterium sp. TaxID=1871053 RepID=UPI0011F7B7A7|nr:hypothetical protein [Phenylobacterium sp.]TAJ70716.1 MAG: hypothetical protein EPO51_16645 [Phenylobacterium sp.]
MKPQIEQRTLDGRDASPHLQDMAGQDDDQKRARDSREAKLAQALRANLRRRKAAPPPPAPNPDRNTTD